MSTNVNKISLPIEWPYRVLGHAFIIGGVFAVCLIAIIIKTEFVQNQIHQLALKLYDYSSSLGFTVDDIIVEGREKTSLQEISDTLNLNRSTNILNLDLNDIKQNLESLPWIKDVIVKRSFFPNVIHISIQERQVQSIWQISEKFYPIDTQGNVINADFKATQPILLIVGPKAPDNVSALLEIIKHDEEIFNRIKVANFISERRWNLVLDDIKDGVIIKLPEENIEAAWKKLINLNKTEGLLKRKLTIVDLRLEDKVIVKLGKSSIKEEIKESNI